MDYRVVFWIITGCLTFLMIHSLWGGFRAIKRCETKEDANDLWCGVVDTLSVYPAFITLYTTGMLGRIYEYLSKFIHWELGWGYFIWTEAAFLLCVISIWIAASVPASVLRIIIRSDHLQRTIKEEASIFYRLALVPLAISYIFLIRLGSIWALLPFLLGLIPLSISILIAVDNFRHIITWKMMLWLAVQATAVIGVGIIAQELMQSCSLFEAMGILYDYSYSANLMSIAIIFCVVAEFLFRAHEHFTPNMYIPMSPSDIEQWKEKNRTDGTDEIAKTEEGKDE